MPSYFELEAQDGGQRGRVLRFDSFSKILSSGTSAPVFEAFLRFDEPIPYSHRAGFRRHAIGLCDGTAAPAGDHRLAHIKHKPAALVSPLTNGTSREITSLIGELALSSDSSTTQAMVIVLLNKWGLDGFLAHCRRVAAFYKEKRDMFEKVAHKYLDGLATWVSPEAGMFVRLFSELFTRFFARRASSLPPFGPRRIGDSRLTDLGDCRAQLFLDLQLSKDGSTPGDSSALISTTALEKGVLAVPGIGFLPNPGVSSFVRVSFSLATEEDAELGFQRLRECILEARGEKST